MVSDKSKYRSVTIRYETYQELKELAEQKNLRGVASAITYLVKWYKRYQKFVESLSMLCCDDE